MVCRRTCRGMCSLCRTLLLVYSPTHSVETTSLRFCVNSIGCRYRDEWSSRLHVWHTNRLRQKHSMYLSADIQLVSEHGCRYLRSSSQRTLAVPSTRTTLGDRSFAVSGLRVWNSLPATIRQITSYRQFRQHLKTHLLSY